ncbi:Mn-containing catalase [Rhodococcus qingshengii BKS 20-40]|nr:Mn-containing catalase [Rhodococcus qingshengii BKS 20-40]
MFRHTDYLQFDVAPEKSDPVYARKLQELLGGAYGEMTVTMQYLFQGWNCRMDGKYKDLIMDIATEEIGHVEMTATMMARLLEGAPARESTSAEAADPVVAAVLGGMDPQQAIISGGGPVLADSNGVPWNGRYIVRHFAHLVLNAVGGRVVDGLGAGPLASQAQTLVESGDDDHAFHAEEARALGSHQPDSPTPPYCNSVAG